MSEVPDTQAKAREQGCTCEWYGYAAILRFDRDCPILHDHRLPGDGVVVFTDGTVQNTQFFPLEISDR